MTQTIINVEAAVGLFVHFAGKETEGAATGFLGVVHRRVGLLHQGVEVAAIVGCHGYTHRGRGVEDVFADIKRFGQGMQNFIGNAGGGAGIVKITDQNDEFIPALPAQCVDVTQAELESSDHGDQQTVADRMTERIVDALEVVKIDEHEGQMFAGTSLDFDHVDETVTQQQAVGQAGQWIVMRHVLNTVFGRLAHRNIGKTADEVLHATGLIAHDGNRQPLGIDFAVFALVPDFAFPCALIQRGLPHVLIKLGFVAAGLEKRWGAPNGFLDAVAGNATERIVYIFDHTLDVGNQVRFQTVGEDAVGKMQLGCLTSPFGNVGVDPDRAFRCS